MEDGTKTRSLLAKELVAGGLLVAVVLVLGLGFAVTPARGGFFRGPGHDPERMRKHAEIAVEVALREVDATPDQIARVKAVADGLIGQLESTHDQHEANRAALLAQLKSPELSRETLQALRAQELALLDDASVKVTDAIIDAAAALTPEQREKLIELAEEMHGHGH
ncbi:MAG TPA: periplasmic heavy metal sensor [Myxococcota bacterium]|nr:periplasmic heavy metal sensor [Myxococcota bacterium]